MTFDELVAEVMERLNLTSDEAATRVGKRVNSCYKRATSSIGLKTTRYIEDIPATAAIGSRLLTFSGIEKILTVIDRSSGVDVPLDQITTDEMHLASTKQEPPKQFCIYNLGPRSVQIKVDGEAESAYVLYADGSVSLATLVGNEEPAFPESFHDILVFGALDDEYRKLEKFDLADKMEKKYEGRLSDLRMWIATSSWQDIYQGKTAADTSFPWMK